MDRLPLEDITILDLTWVIAGPHATRLFRDLGARVIKVESKRSLEFVSFAPVVQAMTGITSSIGYEDSAAPFDSYPPMADYEAALSICNYLMAALEYRRKTGKGQFVDLSQVESATSYMGTAILSMQVNGAVKGLFGSHHYADSAAPHNVYKCKGGEDQWCAIAVASEQEWRRFCTAVDPENTWTANPRFATLEDRIVNQAALDERVSQWTLQYTPDEVGDILQKSGVSGVPVQTARDLLFRDKHLKERDYFMEVDFPPSDKYPPNYIITGPLMRFPERTYPHVVPPAPSVGQNTPFILTEILGPV
jgi:crotonobetainyl-CoA:carnitine CoA-transferase CaiB-like acyl-CoA transferase